jgi:predicted nucleotidyltransferase component of viral defense system
MHTEALSPSQLAILEGLKLVAPVGGFYLAGGTALALRFGHRRSIDFDFFREDQFAERELIQSLDRQFGSVERLSSGEQTTYVRILGVTVSFFQLPYPLIEPADRTPWNFDLASIADIAAMKLEAVAGRGLRKDFVDLYWLCTREIALDDVFRFFERKYPIQRVERYHRLRALTYFDDAETQPPLDMLQPLAWNDVREFFLRETKRLLKGIIEGG